MKFGKNPKFEISQFFEQVSSSMHEFWGMVVCTFRGDIN